MAYYFKLPTYDDLNAKQKVASTDNKEIALSGGPGTGKSVVSIWRHIRNYETNTKKSLLITYTKSLRYFLAQSIRSHSRLETDSNKKYQIVQAYHAVEQANSWKGRAYDEIIIDEAQDLPEYCFVKLTKQKKVGEKFENYEVWEGAVNKFSGTVHVSDDRKILHINENAYEIGRYYYFENNSKRYAFSHLANSIRYIKRFADKVSYGADDNQILYPEKATSEKKLASIFNMSYNHRHKLHVNYRNTYEIMNFVKHTLDYEVSQSTLDRLKQDDNRRGILPTLYIGNDEYLQNKQVLELIEDYNDGTANIAILVPFINQVEDFKKLLLDNEYKLFGSGDKVFSIYHSRLSKFDRIDNVHITTFKSAKGLEYDIVIIPDFGRYKEYIEDSRKRVNDEDYYVAFTRAKTNLFLLSDHDVTISEQVLNREYINSSELATASVQELEDDLDGDDDLPF